MFTDTSTGIDPAAALRFIAGKIVGTSVGLALTEGFHPRYGVAPETLGLPDSAHHRPDTGERS